MNISHSCGGTNWFWGEKVNFMLSKQKESLFLTLYQLAINWSAHGIFKRINTSHNSYEWRLKHLDSQIGFKFAFIWGFRRESWVFKARNSNTLSLNDRNNINKKGGESFRVALLFGSTENYANFARTRNVFAAHSLMRLYSFQLFLHCFHLIDDIFDCTDLFACFSQQTTQMFA